jgi:hypothetical protein
MDDDDVSPVARQVELTFCKRKWREDQGLNNALPQLFYVLLRQGDVSSVPAVIAVSEVTKFVNSDVLNSQYLDLIAHGYGAQLSKYIVWRISEVAQFTGGPILLSTDHMKEQANSLRISKSLTNSGLKYLMQRKIEIRGQTQLLSQFIGQRSSLRCFNMPDYTWERIKFGCTELLTPSTLSYHAGLRDSEIKEAPQSTDTKRFKSVARCERSDSEDSVSDNDSSDDGGQQHMGNNAKKGVRYAFETMVHTMRLSVLLKSARHLKKAVAASLQLASSQGQV